MFYENFERICRANGTSPSAMALALGKNKGAASAWKSNGTIPKEPELKQLAKLLNCKVSDFFDSPVEQVLAIHGTKKLSEIQHEADGEVVRVEHILPKHVPDGEALDDNIRDFILIYGRANNRQRNQLMSAVYDFEEKVLNNDGN